jgi:hypothetical protein
MPTAVDILGELGRSPGWPARWMTVAEIAVELEQRGVWEQPAFVGYTGKGRLDFLSGVLTSRDGLGKLGWVRLGAEFKPAAILSEEDQALLPPASEEGSDALNEDISRILLGEPLRRRSRSTDPPLALEDFLRQARPLIEELTRLAQRVACDGEGRGGGRDGKTLPAARRLQVLAHALADCAADT